MYCFDHHNHNKYNIPIVIGAGPGGLQLGNFFSANNNDYIILERNSSVASFFQKYPRNNRLLSINKIYSYNNHNEFNLRHDWNSLLTPITTNSYLNSNKFQYNIHYNTNNSISFRNFSDDYYPFREDLYKYFGSYSKHYHIGDHIKFHHNVIKIKQDKLSNQFTVYVEIKNTICILYKCKYLFVATGLFKPFIPSTIYGLKKHAIGYETMSMDKNLYKNKRILVLGNKNSAFEIGNYLSGYLHISGNSNPRFSYETHYVGDVRAINRRFLDNYLLKSLDALIDYEI